MVTAETGVVMVVVNVADAKFAGSQILEKRSLRRPLFVFHGWFLARMRISKESEN